MLQLETGKRREREKTNELLEAKSRGRMESIDWKIVSEGPE